MLISRSLARIPGADRLVLAVGVFDGMHRGHRAILATLKRRARAIGARAAVLTFEEHPRKVLYPAKAVRLLSSTEHRLFLLAQAGVEVCFLVPFTRRFSRMSPEAFAATVLARRLGVRELWMGSTARLGHLRTGTPARMKALAARCGFRFGTVHPVGGGRRSISSTRVRSLVESGDLAAVRRLLARPYDVFGRPVAGDARGRALGFPTVNLDVHSEVLPPPGIYAVWAELLSVRHKPVARGVQELETVRVGGRRRGVVNLGTRPTFYGSRGPRVLELHLMSFSGTVRARRVRVLFVRKLRQERKFASSEALVRQINKDVRLADTYLDGGVYAGHERRERVCH